MCIYIPKNVNEIVIYCEFICRLTADAQEDPLTANRRARVWGRDSTSRREGVVDPSTVIGGSEEPAEAGGALLSAEGVAGVPLSADGAAGVLLSGAGIASPPAAGDEVESDPVLVGGASPAGAELTTVGSPVDVGSPAEAETVADATPVDSAAGTEVAEAAAAEASPLADALVTAPTAALIVAELGAAVTAAAALEAASKVADAAGGAMMLVWEETERMVLPDPGLPTAGMAGIAGMLGTGIVIETAEGGALACAALKPRPPAEAAAAASAGVSCLVVLLKTRVVSFTVVAGSRFS